jgi:hypothetical protein
MVFELVRFYELYLYCMVIQKNLAETVMLLLDVYVCI